MTERSNVLSNVRSWPWFFRRQREIPVYVQKYLEAPRPDKNQPWRSAHYVVMDVETSGLDSKRDALLSIGLVEIEHGRIQMDTRWYTLIRPPEHLEVPAASIRIHGLLRDEVARAPTLEEILPELLRRLYGRTLVVHYAGMDIEFLNHALRRLWGVKMRGPAIDTMLVAQALHHYERLTNGFDGSHAPTALRPLAEQAGVPMYEEHNALADAMTTAHLFLLQAIKMEKFGMTSLRKLLAAGGCLR
jgi:DNA polymerase-3 subunit epsilon